MKKSANPTLIGAFVLGAFTLIVLALIFVGANAWFGAGRVSFVCFFEESVAGLQTGSQVKLKGVPVGTVKQILIRYHSEAGESTPHASVPVIIELDAEKMATDLGMTIDLRDEKLYRQQIKDGLRATLNMGSIITGLLQVNLDYKLDAPEVGEDKLQNLRFGGKSYRPIPTSSSKLSKAADDLVDMVANISQTDFKKLGDGLGDVFTKFGKKLDEFEIKGINQTVSSLKERVESPKIDETLSAFSTAAKGLSDVAESLKTQLGQEKLEKVLQSADNSFQALTKAVEELKNLVGKNQELPNEMTRGMKGIADAAAEIGSAAKEIRQFVANLNEHPTALIWGWKDGEKGERNKPPRGRVRP